jgi:DNA polymerase III delta prime subunit
MGTSSSQPVQFVEVKKPSTTVDTLVKTNAPKLREWLDVCRQAALLPRSDQFLEALMQHGTVLQVPNKVQDNLNFFFYAHREKLSHHSARIGIVKDIVHDGFEQFKPNVSIICLTPFAFDFNGATMLAVHWETQVKGDSGGETFALWMPGPDTPLAQKQLCSLVGEINKFVTNHTVITNKISMFSNRKKEWQLTGRLPPRALESVHLANEGDKTRLVNDLKQFYDRQALYEKMGINCKRGYLLYGPPGTGKTSLIRAIACHMGKCVASITLDHDVSDQHIQDLMADLPENSIVVFEDIDRMKNSKVSLSCLLAVLDGNYARGSQVVFLTTNNPDHIEEAMLRHGRADVKLEITFATPTQVKSAFCHLFRLEPQDEKMQSLAQEVADKFPQDCKIPMATVMESFIRLIDYPAVEAAQKVNWDSMVDEKNTKTTATSDANAKAAAAPAEESSAANNNNKKKKNRR